MAFTVPTVADLKARFPVFESVAHSVVTAVLAEAALSVDESWIESDFAPARIMLAAHLLTLEGHGTGAEIAGYQVAGVRSFSSGGLSVTFGDGGSGSGGSLMLTSTSYGKRFLAMRNRNHPPILAVNAAVP